VLTALEAYRRGSPINAGQYRAVGAEKSWRPVQRLLDALDEAFYAAFNNIVPTGKRTRLGLDVSGSMDNFGYDKPQLLTPRQVVGAMAMVTARTEKDWSAVGFCHRLVDLPITPRMRMDAVLKVIARSDFGSTNPGLLIQDAQRNGMKVDSFAVYTDNEANTGRQPFQCLTEYRKRTGIPAKLAVVGITATNFSIADPNDPGMLDFVGFDASAPAIMADFFRG